jgi:hypothetical protein
MRNQRGQVVILVALSIFAILGVAALAIDGSYMYEKRNRLHAAADAAAKSAAIEVHRGNLSGANLQAFVQKEVTGHGFNTSVIEEINCPPVSGPYGGGTGGVTAGCGASQYVEVILREETNTFFASVLGFASMTPRARSVAGSGSDVTCMLALDPTGTGLLIANSTVINAVDCTIAVNSTETSYALDTGNTANISASGIGVTGGWNGAGIMSPTPTTGVVPTVDPLAGLATPTFTPCLPADPAFSIPTNGGTASLTGGGRLCGIDLANSARLTLGAGEWVIDGNINLSQGAIIDATAGTLLYLATRTIVVLDQNSEIQIVAQTSGTWEGIGLFADPTNIHEINIRNNAVLNVSGIVYAPGAHFNVKNNGILDGLCVIIIAGKIEMLNNSITLNNNCSRFGGNPLKTVSLAE